MNTKKENNINTDRTQPFGAGNFSKPRGKYMKRSSLLKLKFYLVRCLVKGSWERIIGVCKLEKDVSGEFLYKHKEMPLLIGEKELARILYLSRRKAKSLMDKPYFPTLEIKGDRYITKENLICWLELDRISKDDVDLNYNGRPDTEKQLIQTAFFKGIEIGINSHKDWELNRKVVG